MNPLEQALPGFDDFAAQLRLNRLPDSPALRGRRFVLGFAEQRGELAFDDQGEARWQGLPLALAAGGGQANVVQACAGLFFIDLPLPAAQRQSLVVVIDEQRSRALLVHSWLDTERKARGLASNVGQALHHAGLDGRPAGAPPERSDELIGKRVLNLYSQDTAVEHVYLNSRWYAYQIHGGVRHGDCDCDEASYFKLRDQLYLVSFREKAVDVAIVFVLDTRAWRNTGMALGEVDGAWFNVPIGAQVRLLSETAYPEGISPL